jgi:hypothetical protein
MNANMACFSKVVLLVVFILKSFISFSNNNASKPLAVANIPKNLLLNANAVVRADELIYTIENTQSSKLKLRHTITLLNDKASDYRRVRIPYNKFSSISGIKTTIYDSEGEIILSAKAEIFDMSANYDELASDQRFWAISFPLRKYPYTIEYEYEKTNKESFFYEDWSFQSQPDVSVEQSGAQYIIPKALGFRVKQLNLQHRCDTTLLDDKIIYTWQEENIPAYKPKEYFLIKFDQKAPVLLTSPNDFNTGGHEGNMESWKSLGKWYYDLNKNRDGISPELEAKLKKMILNVSDTKEQIKLIYNYLQKNTRYVSVQLGIGGYQTLEANYVEKKGIGDCKALTNYMRAMLNSIGIKAYQALVLAGQDEDIYVDFPSQQFNHVILCVPLLKDTIWLECTDQTIPFNYLGSFTHNRHVLILKESGGEITKTPEYGSKDNFRKTSINVKIDLNGDADLSAKMTFSGINYEKPLNYLLKGKKEQEIWINDMFETPNLTIDTLAYIDNSYMYPQVEIKCNLNVRNFAAKTSRRIVLNPYLLVPVNFVSEVLTDTFSIPISKTYADSITLTIPLFYKVNTLPKSQLIESRFGNYQISYNLINNILVCYRQLNVTSGEFGKDDIEPFRNFANAIARYDRRLLVLQKE